MIKFASIAPIETGKGAVIHRHLLKRSTQGGVHTFDTYGHMASHGFYSVLTESFQKFTNHSRDDLALKKPRRCPGFASSSEVVLFSWKNPLPGPCPVTVP